MKVSPRIAASDCRTNHQLASTPAQLLSNYEVLQHFLSLKRENDRLRSDITSHTAHRAADLKVQIPVKADAEDEAVSLPPRVDEREGDEAERRGVSDDLVWVQDEVGSSFSQDVLGCRAEGVGTQIPVRRGELDRSTN